MKKKNGGTLGGVTKIKGGTVPKDTKPFKGSTGSKGRAVDPNCDKSRKKPGNP